MKKNKKLIVLGVLALILIISGITYAILTWTSSRVNIGLTSNCFTIDYTKGNDISGNLKLTNWNDIYSYSNNKFTIKEGMGLSYVNLGIKSTCTIEGYGSLYLNVTDLSETFKLGGDSYEALRYAVLYNTSTLSDTNINIQNLSNQSFEMVEEGSITNTGKITLLTKQLSNTEIYKYLVVIYVNNYYAGNSITSATFNGNISAEAEQGKMPSTPLSTHITNLFNKNATVSFTKYLDEVADYEYDYDTNNNLMKDIAGNIRYYGKEPNNYIYFNCSEYFNLPTCELWRIIGVFDGKVKIMREKPIGYYSWDNKDTSTGAETNAGKNDWTDARLMKLLNPGYESETVGGSLYYNSKSGNCYSGQNNATKTCDFTSTGIKNDTTRNLISNINYSLGGSKVVYQGIVGNFYSEDMYNDERGKTVFTGRPTEWTGKIGLAYPSDYGYATDLSKCKKTLDEYNDSSCTSNNWMIDTLFPLDVKNGGDCFLLTPISQNSNMVWGIKLDGTMWYYRPLVNIFVTPVLYLNPELGIKSGDGSNSKPYQLSVD